MPIYEYHCDNCSHDFEKLESMASYSKDTECPKCNQTAHRKISATSYILTGSGFHNTDYNKPAACPSAGDKPACAGCPASQNK